MPELECLYSYRWILYGETIVFWIGNWDTEWKGKVNTCTALQADISSPGSPQEVLGQQDLWENQRSRDYERGERETDRETGRQKVVIDSSWSPGKNQHGAGVSRSGGYWISGKKQNTCQTFFNPYWHDSWYVALKFTALHWKRGVRAPLCTNFH